MLTVKYLHFYTLNCSPKALWQKFLLNIQDYSDGFEKIQPANIYFLQIK